MSNYSFQGIYKLCSDGFTALILIMFCHCNDVDLFFTKQVFVLPLARVTTPKQLAIKSETLEPS